MKILIICAACIAAALAEPPADNRYLPPNQGSALPSQAYVPPEGGFGSPQRQTDAVFRGNPSSSYGAPSSSRSNDNGRRPSNQYGPSRAPNNQYLPPRGRAPSSQYGTPGLQGNQLSNQFGAPQPSAQYGAPQGQGFGAQGQGLRAQGQGPIGGRLTTPSQQYSAPGFGNEAQARSYLPPGENGSNGYSRNGYSNGNENSGAGNEYNGAGNEYSGMGGYGSEDEGDGEPANYSFEYMVKDDESGNDFGHRESRMGDRAEGLYYVLLPDGRKQTVEYEADQDGYRPKISYEDTGVIPGAGGYNNNAQGQGYSGQGEGQAYSGQGDSSEGSGPY